MSESSRHADGALMTAARDLDDIQEYYGRVLSSTADLKTGACCAPESVPARLRPLIENVHPEVRDRFYGCGTPFPPGLERATVLDLGCGSGRDCYVLSQLVGEEGRVLGVDMTPEQLEVGRAHRDWHARQFGHSRSNVDFLHGRMEDLESLGIADDSVDLVVSNCVFNLSPDKPRLFSELFRVLAPGGELFFSDVFADRRIPPHLLDDPVLRGECLAGAMYSEDFRRLMERTGVADHRTVASHPVELLDPDLEEKIGMVRFTSLTIRAFNLDLEDRCEDYGQVATYRGTLEGHPHVFELDPGHRFETGRPERVCGNTAAMLSRTRYAPHFRVTGDTSVHFGLFPCGPAASPAADSPISDSSDADSPAACC